MLISFLALLLHMPPAARVDAGEDLKARGLESLGLLVGDGHICAVTLLLLTHVRERTDF